MRFVHLGRVGEHRGDRVARADAAPGERRAQAPGARVGFPPRIAPLAVDHRHAIRIDAGGALDERQRRERGVVGGVLVEILLVGIGLSAHGVKYSSAWRPYTTS